ncbi:MAG: hypothetical protein IJ486_06940, partial [Firmicutes bacterium]|nr:hypothetical protein [Bacillota bacterium]
MKDLREKNINNSDEDILWDGLDLTEDTSTSRLEQAHRRHHQASVEQADSQHTSVIEELSISDNLIQNQNTTEHLESKQSKRKIGHGIHDHDHEHDHEHHRNFHGWFRILFFSLCFPYLELLLRLTDGGSRFFELGLLRSITAGAAFGMLLWFLATWIPKKKIARGLTGTILFLVSAIFIIERCCQSFFGTYFQISYMTEMGGQVAGDFMGTAISVVIKNLWFFPLALLPFILFLIFRKPLVPGMKKSVKKVYMIRQGAAFVAMHLLTILICRFGGDLNYYTFDFTANSAIPRFGLVTTLRLEGQYAIFGLPEEEIDDSYLEALATLPSETESE